MQKEIGHLFGDLVVINARFVGRAHLQHDVFEVEIEKQAHDATSDHSGVNLGHLSPRVSLRQERRCSRAEGGAP